MLGKKLLAVFVVSAIAASTTIAQEKIDNDMVWKIRREAMEHSQILNTLHVLTDVHGPRLTGSPNAKAAGEWVVKRTTEWGLKNAHLEPWDFGHPGWLNERTSAFITTPGQGLARGRSAGVDARHQRRRHGFGDPARCAGACDERTAVHIFRREPRESEGQDRDVRRAHQGGREHRPAVTATRRCGVADAVRSQQHSAGAGWTACRCNRRGSAAGPQSGDR